MKRNIHSIILLVIAVSVLSLFISGRNETLSLSDLSILAGGSYNKSTGSHLIFEETFENTSPFRKAYGMETGRWSYALQIVTKPVYEGHKAVRFEIRKEQPLVKSGKRAEVIIVKGSNKDFTRDAWYSYTVYFPAEGYEYDSEREVISQWYQDGSPATSIRTQKDRILLETGHEPINREQYDLGPITKNVWQEFVIHIIHSPGPDGRIEIWHNGTKVLTKAGGNMYKDVLPKWKIGLYKASFKKEHSLVNSRVIYFDNIRVGNVNASFADMHSGKK